ncbi:hypothetical protein HYALB_00008020 [Hymenoscyphus albidus]|uniref:Carboxymuconolactone decarboxylase-like domain-containing protein n=1 Tax=Hymenoscyphus albidus TaxID=595503 RepID=A0A9N9Q1Q1_9HELO|nr:hypothetical protein HYALB_00008020 [Hymenoscyphus albidus]
MRLTFLHKFYKRTPFTPNSINTRVFSHTRTQTMKLPYADPSSPALTTPEASAIVSRVRERRAPRPLQALDLTLLHAPPVADGWNSFLGAIRTKTSLSDDVREIAICRVAVVNEAWYEWGHHAPLAKAAGVSEEGIKVLGAKDVEGEGVLSRKQWAVVRYTDAMTKSVKVPEGVFKELREVFSEREVVEITATVAAYNCVSRFLVALDVGEKNSITGPEL